MIKIGIIGGTGYTGVELLRLLAAHPQADLRVITSRGEAGKKVAELFSNLRGHVDLAFTEPDTKSLAGCDVVFSATPNGVAMTHARELLKAGVKFIDLAADFRLKDPAVWEKWYGMPHACPELLSEAVYGLPEVNREKIKKARLIANPGCYPTAVQLGFLPLLENDVVDPQHLIADAKSGVSGAGRKVEVSMLFSEASDSVGDLENVESFSFFHEAIEHLQRILEIRPDIVAYDLHPDYFSTKWALQQTGVRLVGVQHHHAHIASCMAENHLEGRVIGFALDGTGYGTDGNIWGGEVLITGYEDFVRAAHFENVPLPGGAAAIREPWRMAVSYLAYHFGREFLRLSIPFVRRLDRSKVELLLRMMEQGVNSPLTSSCGRLFDAVAALIGIRQQVNYEAQAAIELEMAMGSPERASSREDAPYPMKLVPEDDRWIISTQPLFAALLDDLGRNVPAGTISRRFHNGLVEGFVELATLLRKKTSLNRVCLSGRTNRLVGPKNGQQRLLARSGTHD